MITLVGLVESISVGRTVALQCVRRAARRALHGAVSLHPPPTPRGCPCVFINPARCRQKYDIDPNAEMLGLGLANLVGSFFHAYPCTGSFSCTPGARGQCTRAL